MAELKNREFYRKTFVLMLPIILQQLITIGINFMDNLMVGSFGETQISAAAFGNQIYSFFQFICMGLGSGAIVMSSQFWGRKDRASMQKTAAMAIRVTAGVCLVFTAVTVSVPGRVLRFFTTETDIITVGSPYMRLIGLTFLLAGLSSTATYLLRSAGSVRIPLIGSAGAFALNVFFNWVFIFGKLGAPRLEIVGAAVGTVIARFFEFAVVFGYFILKDTSFSYRIRQLFLRDQTLRRQYVRYSVPVLISDTSLGLALTLIAVVIGHVGETMAAANSVAGSLIQVISVMNISMSGAAAVVIGNTVGTGDIAKAKQEGNAYIALAVAWGLFVILPLLLVAKPYLGFYNISEETRSAAYQMLIVNCYLSPLQMLAYITSKGILRGGGDTRFLLVFDSILTWLVSLPLGAAAGLIWNMSYVWVYLFLRMEYPLKGLICFARYCSGKWIREIRSGN